MTKKQLLIELMTSMFYEDFAKIASAKVIEFDAVEDLYELATDGSLDLPKAKRQAVIFRAAYVLDYIYFNRRELFEPFVARFCDDFSLCDNESAKRHFGKIMADLLKYYLPTEVQIESIAGAAANWISEPKSKVAVKVWAMAILKSIKDKLAWVDDMWDDIEAVALRDSTQGLMVRLNRGWN